MKLSDDVQPCSRTDWWERVGWAILHGTVGSSRKRKHLVRHQLRDLAYGAYTTSHHGCRFAEFRADADRTLGQPLDFNDGGRPFLDVLNIDHIIEDLVHRTFTFDRPF